jgi:hypothetical protein
LYPRYFTDGDLATSTIDPQLNPPLVNPVPPSATRERMRHGHEVELRRQVAKSGSGRLSATVAAQIGPSATVADVL